MIAATAIGASTMTQRTIFMVATWMPRRIATTGKATSPTAARAPPNRIPNSRTCRIFCSAIADTMLVGIRSRKNATQSTPRPALAGNLPPGMVRSAPMPGWKIPFIASPITMQAAVAT
jgi:hypothetical protein